MNENSSTNENISITNAVSDDASKIVEIEKELWLETYPNSEHGIERNDIERKFNNSLDQIESVAELINNPEHLYLVAKNNGDIIGYFHAQKNNEFNHIIESYILPKFQGRNIGKQAMARMFQWLGEDKTIKVEIASYNTRSLNFFKSFGFVPEIGTEPKEHASWNVLPSGKEIPIISMVKVFKTE